ncbi:ABC transporter permease [Xanthobacter sp. KR7-225]|uniref:ABC transporter permease n=1 Tax=Xanthobacter sp. KR7-225 TaxID=3156613 RepID=UPI0032B52018
MKSLASTAAAPPANAVERGTPLASGIKTHLNRHFDLVVGAITLIAFFLAWQFARPLGIPGLSAVEPPTRVVAASWDLLSSATFWTACYKSALRILAGFALAQIIGVPIGLMMATNRMAFHTLFPITEILRPIPPVAWIPVAIIFWPTREMSTVFIVFLGAFWIVLLNTIGGASTIEESYKRAALSLGSSRWHLFRYIVLPATMPSIVTGMVVGMGISWEMVVAAEMIASDTGLGYLLWQSFEINAGAQVIVCMLAIGIAGFVSSALISRVGRLLTPWQGRR